MNRRKSPESSAAAAAPSAMESLSKQVGAELRRLRIAQGLTLADVSEQARISRAMLSRVETGDVSPSLETLNALADALGTSLSSLFKRADAPASDAQHVRKGEGLEVVRRGTKRGHTYHLLAAERGPRRTFEPFLVTLTDKSEVFQDFEHPGTEFIHVLEGSLSYRHGSEVYLLKPGDSLTFRGDVPHGPEKLIRAPIRMLSIIMYTGDRGED